MRAEPADRVTMRSPVPLPSSGKPPAQPFHRMPLTLRRRLLATLVNLVSLLAASGAGYATFRAGPGALTPSLPPPEPRRPPPIVREVRSGPRETADEFFARRSDVEGNPAESPGGVALIGNVDELQLREYEDLLRSIPWSLSFTETQPIVGYLGGGGGGGGGEGPGLWRASPLWNPGDPHGPPGPAIAALTGGTWYGSGSHGSGSDGDGSGSDTPGDLPDTTTPEPGSALVLVANTLVVAQALRRKPRRRS